MPEQIRAMPWRQRIEAMSETFSKFGADCIAKTIRQTITNDQRERAYVITGLRTPEECSIVSSIRPGLTKIVAVQCPQDIRLKRLLRRSPCRSPATARDLCLHDTWESSIGLSTVLTKAEIVIFNDLGEKELFEALDISLLHA
jgi:hypothetical protein